MYDVEKLSPSELKGVLARPRIDFTSILSTVSGLPQSIRSRVAPPYLLWRQVSPIVEDVRTGGDEAVKRFTEKFDRVNLQSVCVRIEVSSGPMHNPDRACHATLHTAHLK